MVNKYPKKKFPTQYQPEDIVIQFLASGHRQFGEIWDKLQKMEIHYDSKTSLVKLLTRLQKKGIVMKKDIRGKYPLYYLTKDSRLVVESFATMFKIQLDGKFATDFINILSEIYQRDKTVPDDDVIARYTLALVQYFGLYVMYGILTSMQFVKTLGDGKKIKKSESEELQHLWLKQILSLEEGLSASGVFYHMMAELAYFDDKGKQTFKPGTVLGDNTIITSTKRLVTALERLYPYTTDTVVDILEQTKEQSKNITEDMQKEGKSVELMEFLRLFRTPVQYGTIKFLSQNPATRDALLKNSSSRQSTTKTNRQNGST